MAQEGVNPPQDIEGSHDRATFPGESTPAGVGSATSAMTAGSKSSSVKPASAENNNAESKPASPEVVHAGENSARSKPDSPVVAHAGENSARSRPDSPVVVHAGENKAGSKPASPAAAVDACENDAGEVKNGVTGEEGGGDAAAAGSGGGARSNSKSTQSSSDSGVHDVAKDAPAAGGSSGKGKGAKEAEAEHALHIWTERERRKKMKNMFSSLHALLPRLPDKADKATIVGEAVNYIRVLEGTLQRLEKLKQERMRAEQLGVDGSMAPASSSTRHAAPVQAPAPAPATREAVLADMVLAWNAQQAAGARSSAAPPAAFQTWSGPNVAVSMAGDDAFISLCTPRQRGMLTKALLVLERHCIDVVATNVSSDRNRCMFSIHARINGASAHFPENLTAEDRYKLAVSEILHWLAK